MVIKKDWGNIRNKAIYVKGDEEKIDYYKGFNPDAFLWNFLYFIPRKMYGEALILGCLFAFCIFGGMLLAGKKGTACGYLLSSLINGFLANRLIKIDYFKKGFKIIEKF